MRHRPGCGAFGLGTNAQIGCNSITQVSKFLEVKVASTSSRSSCESISHDLDAPRGAALCHSPAALIIWRHKGMRPTVDSRPDAIFGGREKGGEGGAEYG